MISQKPSIMNRRKSTAPVAKIRTKSPEPSDEIPFEPVSPRPSVQSFRAKKSASKPPVQSRRKSVGKTPVCEVEINLDLKLSPKHSKDIHSSLQMSTKSLTEGTFAHL